MVYCWQGVSLPLHTLVEINEVDTYSLFAVGLRNRDHPITPLSWLFHLLYHLKHFHSFQLLLCCFLKGNGQSAWSIECKWLSVLLQLQGCESLGFYPNSRILSYHCSYTDGFYALKSHIRILLRTQPRGQGQSPSC